MSTDPTQVDRRALLQNALAAVEKMQAKLDAVEQAKREPIAIIGMSCRFPGGANNPEAYWQLLHDGIDATSQFPADRLNNAITDEMDMYWHGGFIDGIDQFDAQFFGLAPREVASMDPQQRLVLEVSWEALERAGQAPDRLQGSQTGIFIGITTNDYGQLALLANPTQLDAYVATGGALNVAPGRVAYTLGFQGPSVAVDTACSSSLVAIHLACQSLRSGESNLALAGGVNALLRPEAFVCFKSWGMMSSDGHCKTFDASADGFVRGEGCGIIVLKRFSDAVANGDNILAVIRGSAVNQDGKSSGLTVPNGRAQEAVIRNALKNAGVKPSDVSYVEAHGTGTALGDPIEVEALGAALGEGRAKDQPLVISSVKTNIGHLESAAGIAGVIKTVLTMQHREFPPHLHLKERSPQIPWPRFPVIIPTEPTAWETNDKPRFAGVSSFGFSGTNAHVVLEEAPVQSPGTKEHDPQVNVINLSAKNEAALKQLAATIGQHLTNHPEESLADISFTLNSGRAQLQHRMSVVADSRDRVIESLRAFAGAQNAANVVTGQSHHANLQKIVFLFTGQGSQYIGMGRQLYETEPVFRQTMDRCDELLRPYLKQSLLKVIYPTGNESESDLLHQTAYTQPALFALEYSLAELWKSWGIRPSAVMGHSVGEYVAACVAGVFSLEDGLKLITERGRLMQDLPSGGKMAAVFADQAKVSEATKPYLDQVSIAALNGEHVVISGVGTAIDAILETLTAQSIKVSRLNVSHAFHSPLMEPMLDEFSRVAASVHYSAPQIQLISNVTGEPADQEVTNATYWRNHIRSAVQFARSMETLQAQGYQVFLEVGPKPTLIAMGQRILTQGNTKSLWIPSLREKQDDRYQILQALATLHVNGVEVDWHRFHSRNVGTPHRLVLPTYPFQHSRHWFEARKAQKRRDREIIHPLVNRRIRTPKLSGSVFEAEVGIDFPSFLNDHRIYEMAIFPGTGYLEMALVAADQMFEGKNCSLENVSIEEMVSLPNEGDRTIQIILSPLQSGKTTFEIYSLNKTSENNEEAWKRHVSGTIRVKDSLDEKPESVDLEKLKATFPNTVDVPAYYEQLAELGLNYGPSFRGIQQILQGNGTALGRIVLPPDSDADSHGYHIHPALLDSCFQLLGTAEASLQNDVDKVYVPIGLDQLTVYQSGQTQAWAEATFSGELVTPDGSPKDTLAGNIRLFGPTGELIAEIVGLQLRQINRSLIHQMMNQPYNDWLYELRWEPSIRPDTKSALLEGSWLILADEEGVGNDLVQRMAESGANQVVVKRGDEYKQLSENNWQIDPSRYDHIERLLATLKLKADQPLRGVIHLWSLDNPFDASLNEMDSSKQLKEAQKEIYGGILNLVQGIGEGFSSPIRLWLVSRGAYLLAGDQNSPALVGASLWGLGRTVALEYPEWQCTLVDLDPTDISKNGLQLFNEISTSDDETQIALRGNQRFAARLAQHKSKAKTSTASLKAPFELVTTSPGLLDNLSLQATTRRTLKADEVEIRVQATGLNFRDVLNALGMYPGPAIPLGNECAGTIIAVGKIVTEFAVGDEVIGLTTGAFRSHATIPAERVFHKPANLTLSEAATIPTTFLTAYYGLHHLAGIKKGDRVLIHAAAGGVGLAAVQLAQRVGAEIYATAGSDQKRDYLRSIGIHHVFDSRSLGFADELMRVTEGQGVNIVLNSLADEFIRKSFSVLAEHGYFLELGKRDDWDQEKVKATHPTLKYYRYDLGMEMLHQLPSIRSMLNDLLADFEAGGLKSLPFKIFHIDSVRDAFRYMAQAKHIGKIVVSQEEETTAVRENGTYLITGGLGGLGLVTAQWLIDEGAKHLALMGRSHPKAETQAAIDTYRANGIQILVIQGDVSKCEEVEHALHQIESEMPPLRGIIHAAGVLDDGVLRQQTWERFEHVLAPKAHGAWNLHTLTKEKPLDFFVLFSSGSSLLGSAGQGNYAAGNAFLDGLAHYRHSQGLAAQSINWGSWAEVGMAASLDGKNQRRRETQGMDSIKPAEGVMVLKQAIAENPVQLGVLPIHWARFNKSLQGKPVPSFLRNLAHAGQETVHTTSGILDQLRALPANERDKMLQKYTRGQITNIMGLDSSYVFDPASMLTDIGMDSLMAVELKNRIESDLNVNVPITYFLQGVSLTDISSMLQKQLDDSHSTNEMVDAEKAKDLLANMDQLSDEDVDSLLDNLLGESNNP